jgi:type 1 fimbria pilin
MNYRILIAALCLGILVGITIFQPDAQTATGTATFNCYVENEPCSCDSKQCVCGNQTIPAEQCSNKV